MFCVKVGLIKQYVNELYMFHLPCDVGGINPSSSTLKLEAVGSSETLVNTANITWHINPDDQHLNRHRRGNLISNVCELV
jgi:hypothetical protein